ncbi:MAG: hypothetical protein IPK37_14365 [Austwickia sp.]|nr:MAG: hypothetical protein IPK37_14365 [Austwickia sp.]
MTATHTRVVVLAFVALSVVLGMLMPGNVLRGAHGHWAALLFYVLLIAVAEQFRLDIPGRLPTSSISAAAGMGLAVTTKLDGYPFWCSSAEVLVVVLLGQWGGQAVLVARGRMRWDDLDTALDAAIRLFTVAVAAAIVRELPLFRGATLEVAGQDWPGWLLAFVIVGIGLLTALFEAPLRSVGRTAALFGGWRTLAPDDARSHYPLGAAVAATGALIALTSSVLGLVAVPLLLAFLGLTDFAVRRFVHVQDTYAQALRSLSRMPEIVGYVAEGHAARVSELARLMAREMRMSERETEALSSAALVHDLGQLELRRTLPRGATVQAAPSDQQRIADRGAMLLREGGPPGPLANLLCNQSVPYHRVMSGRADVPIGARIIKVANAFDDYGGRLGPDYAEARRAGMERIYLGLGYEYDPRVVEALSRALNRLHPAPDPTD